MGAIQSAINQGLATAGILYSQSATAEQRKKDFADKRELKDINAQLEQLAPAREDLKKQANIWVENKADLKEIQKLPQDEQDTALRVEEDRLNKMKAGSELYHDMTIDLNKRKFGLTKDPRDLAELQKQRANQMWNQTTYDERRAEIARERTQMQQRMAKSIKPRNFYKELREMELNDEQQ